MPTVSSRIAAVGLLFVAMALASTVVAVGPLPTRPNDGCAPWIYYYDGGTTGPVVVPLSALEQWENGYSWLRVRGYGPTVTVDDWVLVEVRWESNPTIWFTPAMTNGYDLNSDGLLDYFIITLYRNPKDLQGLQYGWEDCTGGCSGLLYNARHYALHEMGHICGWYGQSHAQSTADVMWAPGDAASAALYDAVVQLTSTDLGPRNAAWDYLGQGCPVAEFEGGDAVYCVCGSSVSAPNVSAAIEEDEVVAFEVVDSHRFSAYSLEGSDDLKAWRQIERVRGAEKNVVEFQMPSGSRFYRILGWEGLASPGRVLWIGNEALLLAVGSPIERNEKDRACTASKTFDLGGNGNGDRAKVLGPRVDIYFPSVTQEWRECALVLKGLYEYYYGANVELVEYVASTTPVSALEARDAVREEIANRYPGVHYVHLIGDSNDWEVFSTEGPDYGQWWTAEWAAQYNLLTTTFGYSTSAQIHQNLLPTFYYPQSAPPTWSPVPLYPYHFSDLPYSDIDGDGLPDVALGRWPVDTIEEFWTLVNKFYNYHSSKFMGNGRYSILRYIGNTEYYVGAGDGAAVVRIDSVVVSRTPVDQFYGVFDESAWLAGGGIDKLSAAVAAWNTKIPDLITILSSRSSRYSPGWMFPVLPATGWSEFGSLNAPPSVILSAGCGSGDYVSTEQLVDGVPVRPACERMLLDSPATGAVVFVGPTVDTWQSSNGIVLERVLRFALEDPDRSVAEAYRLAMREILETYDSASIVSEVARAYSMLGDPLTTLRRSGQACSVEASAIVVEQRVAPCGDVELSWATDVRITCDYTVRNGVGDIVATGATLPGRDHSVAFAGEPFVAYKIEVTPRCEGAPLRVRNWIVKECIGQQMVARATGLRGLGPNPFNPAVEVAYSLGGRAKVDIRVYDLRGALVAVLENGVREEGSHVAIWNGRAIDGGAAAAGAYVVVFESGGIRQREKVLLLK